MFVDFELRFCELGVHHPNHFGCVGVFIFDTILNLTLHRLDTLRQLELFSVLVLNGFGQIEVTTRAERLLLSKQEDVLGLNLRNHHQNVASFILPDSLVGLLHNSDKHVKDHDVCDESRSEEVNPHQDEATWVRVVLRNVEGTK